MTRSRPSWALLLVAAAVAAVWSREVPSAVEATTLRAYPETWQVAARDVASFRPFLARFDSERKAAGLPKGDPTDEQLASAVRRAGSSAVRAALRARIEWEAEGRTANPETGIETLRTRWPNVERALRDVAGTADDAFLLKIVRDGGLSPFTRSAALSVLCRPGNESALGPLTGFVLDASVPGDLRKSALCELPRIGTPLPDRLARLLGTPGDDLDIAAACVFAAHSETIEAPTLVATALGRLFAATAPHVPAAIETIRRVAGDDPVVAASLAAIDAETATRYEGSAGWRRTGQRLRGLGIAFADWIDRHPASCETAWERARVADARSERRVRARQIRALLWASGRWSPPTDPESTDAPTAAPLRAADLDRAIDVLHATPDETLDPAVTGPDIAGTANALICEDPGEEAGADLDRIAQQIRGDIERVETPAAKLDVLRAALVPPEPQAAGGDVADTAWSAVRWRRASCVGWTLAFTGLADRLGLPIRAVSVPGHVFVRWDDGTTHLNFDPSFDCATWSDDEVVRRFGIPDTQAARAAHLRPLSKREILAISLTNEAFRKEDDAPETARILAEGALRLDPGSLSARLVRARLAARRGDREGVASIVAECETQPTFTPTTAATAATALTRAGDPIAALDLLDRHPPDASCREAHVAVRVEALLVAGRAADAWALADELLRPSDVGPGVAALAVHAALASGGVARADAAFSTAVRRGTDQFALVWAVSSRLVEATPRSRRAARYVLTLLERKDAKGRAFGNIGAAVESLNSPRDIETFFARMQLSLEARGLKAKARAITDDTSLPEDP